MPDVEPTQLVVELPKAHRLGSLLDEGFHQLHPRNSERFLHVGRHLRQLSLRRLARLEGGLANAASRQQEGGQHHQRGDRQLPVQREHQDNRAGKNHNAVDQAEDRVRDDALDAVDVVAESRHDVAGSGRGEEGDRLLEHPIEELVTEVEHDALADPVAEVGLDHTDQPAKQGRADQQPDQERDETKLAMLTGQVVDQVTGDDGGHETKGRGRTNAGEHDEGEPPIRHEVAEHPLEERPLQLDVGLRFVKSTVPPLHAG